MILVCFYITHIYYGDYYSHVQMKKCWAGKAEKLIRMQAKDKLFEASLITQSQILLRYNTGKNPIIPWRCFFPLSLAVEKAGTPASLIHWLILWSISTQLYLPGALHLPSHPKRRLQGEINAVCGCTTLYHIFLSVVSGFSNISSEFWMLLKVL